MHPELFRIGPVVIYSYGLMLGIAFIVGSFLAVREARRKDLNGVDMLDFLLMVLVAGLVGSRLYYVGSHLSEYLSRPLSILDIRDGAGTFHGGLLGGVAFGIWYAHRKGISFWRLADALAPSLAIGAAIGRVGCLLAGCCYGSLSTVAWAVTTRLAPGWRHPAQIYESVLDLAIFGFLWVVYRKRRLVDGQVFLAFVGLYSIARFIVEFYREPEVSLGPVTLAQVVSIVLGIAAFSLSAYMSRRARGA